MAERGLALTSRDVELVDDIRLSGVLGIRHIAALYFGGISRARRRMAHLERAGLVRRIWVADGGRAASSAFAAAPRAAELLVSRGLADRAATLARSRRPVSRMHLAHCLGVASVRVALGGAEGTAFLREPEAFHAYRATRAGRTENRSFRPDGCFLSASAALFLEFDTGAASASKFAGTCGSYADYVALGLFRSEYGDRRAALLVVTSAGRARAARLAAIAARESGLPSFAAELSEVERHGRSGACFRAVGVHPASFDRIASGGSG